MRLSENWLPLIVAIGVCAASCTQADGNDAANILERGERLYGAHCSACHESEAGIGPMLPARVLASYGTARRLFDYTRVTMPYGLPNSIDREDYWAIVAFLVVDRGLVDEGVPPDLSADSIVLRLRDQ